MNWSVFYYNIFVRAWGASYYFSGQTLQINVTLAASSEKLHYAFRKFRWKA